LTNRFFVLMSFTALMLAATLGASLSADRRKPEALARPLEQIPMKLGDWSGYTLQPPDQKELEVLAATAFLSRRYRKPGLDLELFIAYYATQRAGESMHSPKHCLPGAGWEIGEYGSAQVAFHGRPRAINRFRIRHGGASELVFYWYQTRDRIIANEYLGKLFLFADTVTKAHTSGSIVRVIAPDMPGVDRDTLAFAETMASEMEGAFGRE
jgi:EpsI family protein